MSTAVKHTRLRIAVLMGGKNIEREVSFNSGRTVCDHLDAALYEVLPLFQDITGALYFLPWHFLHRGKISDFRERLIREVAPTPWDELKNLVDFVYIAVHGRYEEDGCLQGMLEVLGIPYLGSKILGSALGMDKAAHKDILALAGIEVPRGFVVHPGQLMGLSHEQLAHQMAVHQLSFPLIVKPSHEGSSLGVSVAYDLISLKDGVVKAGYADELVAQAVIVEEKVPGMEFVCVSLEKIDSINPKARSWYSFPITEVVVERDREFFDYEQKYMPGMAEKITPARCSDELSAKAQRVCERVAQVLHFETLSRVDGIITPDGRVVIIDPNTLTGMGPTTFLFHQAAEVGLSHTRLINLLIQTELIKYGMYVQQASEDNMSVAEGKKRVVVLFGGDSYEREVSLETGRNACYKIPPSKYEVIPVFVNDKMELFKLDQRLLIKNNTRSIAALVTENERVFWYDLPKMADFVFIGLHGGKGENGAVQGALEMMDLPYNGPGVLASALCMDKFETNKMLKAKGFEVPGSILVDREEWLAADREVFLHAQMRGGQLEFPLVVKPHDDGCSMFVSKVETVDELAEAVDAVFAAGKQVAMLEEFVVGMELTVGVLGNDDPVALVPSKAVVSKGVLSLAEKFLPGAGENQTPAPLPSAALEMVRRGIREAFIALGCVGYSRIDCFYQTAEQSKTGKERLVLLEVNTVPALTPATCFFHQAAELGIKPMEVFDRIITLGFERRLKHTERERADQRSQNLEVQANLF